MRATESFEIQGVKVEFAQTSSSANPDQEGNPNFEGMVLCAFHNWYRINGGEWRGSLNINMEQLLYEFSEALTPYAVDGPKKNLLLDDEVGKMGPVVTDSDRLDKLQNLTRGYGYGWILRPSTSGRGMRLHETELPGAASNVRQAIDDYTPNKTSLKFSNPPPSSQL